MIAIEAITAMPAITAIRAITAVVHRVAVPNSYNSEPASYGDNLFIHQVPPWGTFPSYRVDKKHLKSRRELVPRPDRLP